MRHQRRSGKGRPQPLPPIDYAKRAVSPGGLTLLVLLPAGAGISAFGALVASASAGRAAPFLGFGGALAGLAFAGYLSWRWAGRRRIEGFFLLVCGLVGILYALRLLKLARILGVPVSLSSTPMPVRLLASAFLAGVCLVGLVVTILWMTGRYHFDRPVHGRHWIRVWEMPGSQHTDKDDYYQAWCHCRWRSEQYRLSQPDARTQAFEEARRHGTTVARRVKVDAPQSIETL